MHPTTNDVIFHDCADFCTARINRGSNIHHGVLVKTYKAPSSIQERGWVMGSRIVRNVGRTYKNPSSSAAVKSRDWGIEPQALCKLSSDGKGISHHGASSFLRLFRLISDFCFPLSHHSERPRKLNIFSNAAIISIPPYPYGFCIYFCVVLR